MCATCNFHYAKSPDSCGDAYIFRIPAADTADIPFVDDLVLVLLIGRHSLPDL